jgi:glyoxylase-like metal-dependent hydrolase (beta-lactamase superfamily II)
VPKYLCKACGIQHPERPAPPENCLICEDPRQFVPAAGQQWITPKTLAVGRFNVFRKVAPGLFGISTVPQFAIGQRAFLVVTPAGNMLWDCLSFLDDATIEIIRALGGIKAVAVSHPHFYSAMATWGRTFDCPVFVHDADRQWCAILDRRDAGHFA